MARKTMSVIAEFFFLKLLFLYLRKGEHRWRMSGRDRPPH